MLLSHALDLVGIKSVVVERRPRDYVLGRVRAGVLEAGTVEFLRQLGLNERLDRLRHDLTKVHYGFEGRDTLVLDLLGLTGKHLTAYGQTFITEDLYQAHDAAERPLFDAVEDARIEGIQGDPVVHFTHEGAATELACDFVVGCDGFHGVSRMTIPASVRREWERVYPFGWLGILAEVPPLDELFYAYHSDGFMLASRRTPTLSRYYVQCSMSETTDDWSDDRFWDAIQTRLPEEYRHKVTTGPSIEKSIAPLRSFVSEPMQYGKLFLAGDAAHIVPPTGAKGLNLAVSDVYYLSRALDAHYNSKNSSLLEGYSATALARVWSSVNLSWQLTRLLHAFPGEDPFDARIRQNDFDLLLAHEPMRAAMAYEKIGIPF